ncbi:MAG: DUF4123 domain-containing protein [Vibrio fluvialis]
MQDGCSGNLRSGCDWRLCTPLFNPGGADGMSSMGAFMVDLRQAQKALGASTFQRRFLKPWGREYSVCLRTGQTANDLCRHLRKFLRLRRADDGKQVYLRFWDARVALPYFSGLAEHPARLSEWLLPREGGAIEELIFETDDKWLGWRARPTISSLTAGPHAIKPELSLAEIAILKEARLAAFDRKVAIGLWDSFKGSAPPTLEDSLLGPKFVRMAREEAGASVSRRNKGLRDTPPFAWRWDLASQTIRHLIKINSQL